MTSPGTNYTEKEQASQRKPVEIYHFWTDDQSTDWRYTSHDSTIAYLGSNYTPALISRGEIEKTRDLEISMLDITVKQVDPLIVGDLVNPQTQRIWAEVYKLHKTDLTLAKVIFLGFISSTFFDGTNCKIECTGFEKFLHRIIPKERYQPTCNNTLFDGNCSVLASNYSTLATVTSVSSDGLTLGISGLAALSTASNYYQLGFIKGGDGERRMVVSSTSTTLKLRMPFSSIATNDAVTVYAGCDKRITTCSSKFSNSVNFLGHPYMPTDNPCLWT